MRPPTRSKSSARPLPVAPIGNLLRPDLLQAMWDLYIATGANVLETTALKVMTAIKEGHGADALAMIHESSTTETLATLEDLAAKWNKPAA